MITARSQALSRDVKLVEADHCPTLPPWIVGAEPWGIDHDLGYKSQLTPCFYKPCT